jgi:hypothetical protein
VRQEPEYFCGAPVAIARSMESKSSASETDARPTAKSEMRTPTVPVPPKPNGVFVTMAKMKLTTAKIA